MRHLLEGWRKCISDKPIFGDKGEMYFSRFGAACAAVFPECKFILTVRNPLDTISSYLKQDWSAYLLMGPTKEYFFRNVQNLVREMLEGNAFWRDRAEVIEFEQLASRDGFTETFETGLPPPRGRSRPLQPGRRVDALPPRGGHRAREAGSRHQRVLDLARG